MKFKNQLPPNGRRSKYPWRTWLRANQTVTLVRGRDFDGEPEAFSRQVRNWASRLRVSVEIQTYENSLIVVAGRRFPEIKVDRCLA